MHPYTVKFGGGADATILSPFVLAALILATVLFFALPRKYAVAPLLLAIFLVPEGQQFLVAGVHLFISRLLVLGAFIRAVTSKPPGQKSLYAGGWTSIDTASVSYMVIVATATVMQYMSAPAIINQVGYLWDCVLGYLALRMLIQDERDAVLAIKCCAGLTVIFATTMMIEQSKMTNVFGLLGGVQLVPEVRDGAIRSQGVFQHALTAGTFGATAIPLFFLMWKKRTARWLCVVGMLGATVMTVTTQTSTSLMTEAAAILAICMWPLRKNMRTIRIGLVGALITLSMVMKAPIWFIIAHIDLTGSSSSYQRAELIDQFVNHFSSWCFMGTTSAASWGLDMWDAQNMYVSTGEAGGLAALVFFILVITRCFSRIGNARKRARSKQQEWILWLVGAALFAHVVAFFGVNYFDQVRMTWFLLVSIVCAVTAPLLSRNAKVASASVIVHVNIPPEAELHAQPGKTRSAGQWGKNWLPSRRGK